MTYNSCIYLSVCRLSVKRYVVRDSHFRYLLDSEINVQKAWLLFHSQAAEGLGMKLTKIGCMNSVFMILLGTQLFSVSVLFLHTLTAQVCLHSAVAVLWWWRTSLMDSRDI